MGLALQQPITTATHLLNDLGGVTYTPEELLRYANDALDAILNLAPPFFYERGNVGCTVDEALQSVSFDDAHALVSVDRVVNGDVVWPADKAALDRFQPGWMVATPGPAKNWMPHPDSQKRFYISPPAPAAQVLEVTYVRLPGEYADTDDTGLPTTLGPAITDYIVAMAMSKDDEHINSNRAQAFLASFVARVKGA